MGELSAADPFIDFSKLFFFFSMQGEAGLDGSRGEKGSQGEKGDRGPLGLPVSTLEPRVFGEELHLVGFPRLCG